MDMCEGLGGGGCSLSVIGEGGGGFGAVVVSNVVIEFTHCLVEPSLFVLAFTRGGVVFVVVLVVRVWW